ncbi:MAG: hypothetical protein JW912_07150 [Sedimentisphaerales bacterium]|nr:hypothetical protein [Sedimentisphaerales bacterium]
MGNKCFSISDLVGYGWRVTTSNLGFFIILGLIFWPLTYVSSVLHIVLGHSGIGPPLYAVLYILIMILGYVISFMLAIGLIKIILSFIDGRKPSVSELFDFYGCFWRYSMTWVLYFLIICGGFILLIVPGIIWSIQFSLAVYYVVDKRLGPIEALKASSRTTKGVKWELFGLGIIGTLIMVVGLLCLVVGILVAYPLMMITYVLAYRQLLAQTPELAEFGIGPDPIVEQPLAEPVLKDLPVNENMQ